MWFEKLFGTIQASTKETVKGFTKTFLNLSASEGINYISKERLFA
jgi:hypothetical protein